MWADKFTTKANMRGYDEILSGTMLAIGDEELEEELNKEQVKSNELNKKSYIMN